MLRARSFFAVLLGCILSLTGGPSWVAASAPKPAVKPAGKPGTKAGTKVVKRVRWPPVELFAINNRETMILRIADERGRPVKGVQRRMDRFLRCHHTRKQFRMNPRLTRLIYETARHWPGHRLEVVSGYRHPTVARNPKSPHKKGLACDFRVAGVKNAELRDYLRQTFKSIGVGYYPNSSFVHLDVRAGKSAFWIDYSGPGEAAFYSNNAREDLKNGKADAFKPGQPDPAVEEHDDDGSQAKPPGVVAGPTAKGQSPPNQ